MWYLRAMRKKGSLAEWELRRNLAVNLLDQGMKPAAVAKAMNVDRVSRERGLRYRLHPEVWADHASRAR